MAACHDVLPRSHLGEGVKVTGRGLLGLQRFAVRRERVDAVTPVLLIDVLIRTRGDHFIHLCGSAALPGSANAMATTSGRMTLRLERFTSISSWV